MRAKTIARSLAVLAVCLGVALFASGSLTANGIASAHNEV